MSVFKRLSVVTALGGGAVLLLGTLAYASGARVNTTRSIPVGLYWVSSNPVGKGAYVWFCPPANGVFAEARSRGYIGAGFCPGGHGYMMKKILAAKTDSVEVTTAGVRINGSLLPLSAPLAADASGRPLPRYSLSSYTLQASDVLLMSDVSATSFDGRYFGPIHQSQIKTVILPVITW